MSDQETNSIKRISELKERIEVRALEIIHELLPAKIVELYEVIESKNFGQLATMSFDEWRAKVFDAAINAAPVALEPRKRDPINSIQDIIKLEPKYVETNRIILEPLERIKKEFSLVAEWMDLIQTWIQLNIPRIQSQDSIGVGVQAEVIGILGGASNVGPALLESIPKYYLGRAKLIKKAYKYSNFEDYARAIYELDRAQTATMSKIIVDIYYSLVTTHDVLVKNLEKLGQPLSEMEFSLII